MRFETHGNYLLKNGRHDPSPAAWRFNESAAIKIISSLVAVHPQFSLAARRSPPPSREDHVMTLMSRTLIAACASLLLAGSAFAQTPAPATGAAPAAKSAPAKSTSAKPAAAKPERSAVSLDCSKQADAKGLHGKERKKFRSQCKRDAAKKN
jgi:hypothetical protein